MSLDRSDVASWIPGYTFESNNFTVDITASGGLGERGLTSAEAHATTGDIGEIMRTLMECIYQEFISVPFAERPVNFIASKSASINAQTGQIEKVYTLRMNCESESVNVLPEPE